MPAGKRKAGASKKAALKKTTDNKTPRRTSSRVRVEEGVDPHFPIGTRVVCPFNGDEGEDAFPGFIVEVPNPNTPLAQPSHA